MTEISTELVERMVSLIRDIHRIRAQFDLPSGLWADFEAVVADIPEPADPDLIEAREMFIEIEGGLDADAKTVRDVRNGAADNTDEVRLLLQGIKRGRKLQSSNPIKAE